MGFSLARLVHVCDCPIHATTLCPAIGETLRRHSPLCRGAVCCATVQVEIDANEALSLGVKADAKLKGLCGVVGGGSDMDASAVGCGVRVGVPV